MIRIAALATMIILGSAAPSLDATDLAKRYPATMDWSAQGLETRCSEDDVWKLKSFEFDHGPELKIRCKKSTVALGVHKTNVLWAVVFPEKPVKLQSNIAGRGEQITSILIRFAPSEINDVFPPKTVGKEGDSWLGARADRIFRKKIGWKWYTPSGNPTIVPKGFVIVDVETLEGKRRFFGVNTAQRKVEYIAEFEDKVVPSAPPISKRAALEAFDEVWEAFDRDYAMFGLLPKVHWGRLGKKYRKEAGSVDNLFDLGAVVSDLLTHLEDLHVWVKAGDDFVPGYSRDRPLNANWSACEKILGGIQKGGRNLSWGQVNDLAYINVHGLNDANLPAEFDKALESLKDSKALVLDLRFNGGGDESLARQIAGRFADKSYVYSKNRYRNGPKHDQLGPVLERRFEPRGPWRYDKPVIALLGRKVLSSAESFALMLAQCPQVTTMGEPTGGSSANPRRLELECGLVVNVPRWIDMDPDGNPIERMGVAPKVKVSFPYDKFTNENDPLLAAAMKRLR